MNLVCEVCSFLLLCNVEFTFVHTVYNYSIALLFTCKVMKYHTFLTGVDHCTVV